MKLGNQELDLLRYISEHQPVTSRDVTDGYGAATGLARTTILTVMERLRQKGFLHRKKAQGGYVYSAVSEPGNVMQGLVGQFVQNTLGGSLSPIAAYLAQSDGLSSDEIAELKEALSEIERRQKDA